MFGVFGAYWKIEIDPGERNNLTVPVAYGYPRDETSTDINHS
jgi:hypothetical protein